MPGGSGSICSFRSTVLSSSEEAVRVKVNGGVEVQVHVEVNVS
jgi:hypothetical protein